MISNPRTRPTGGDTFSSAGLVEQWQSAGQQIAVLERQIFAWHKSNCRQPAARHHPAVSPFVASAVVAIVGNAERFKSGRQFSAWIELVPAQNSTGGRERLGGIAKTGDRYLQQLLVVAATGMILRARQRRSRLGLPLSSPGCQKKSRRGARQQDDQHRLGPSHQKTDSSLFRVCRADLGGQG
jgi:transposase